MALEKKWGKRKGAPVNRKAVVFSRKPNCTFLAGCWSHLLGMTIVMCANKKKGVPNGLGRLEPQKPTAGSSPHPRKKHPRLGSE